MIEIIFKKLPWNKRIEVLRVVKGWNQKEAAERCITNQKVYWLWERGKCYPRLISKKAIARAYGVNVEDIFSPYDDINKAS